MTAPIGIIDSGLGGLAVAQEIWKTLPRESIIYLGDHAFFPYGQKETSVLNKRLVEVVNFLLGKKIKALVVACNTATVSTIGFLRQIYSLPIVGTEPAVKTALKEHNPEQIMVLATEGTAKQSFYGSGEVKVQACPGLAEAIELEAQNPQKLEKLIKKTLSAIDQPYTALILGCTHYLLVKDLFISLVPSGVEVFDPSEAIAKRVEQLLSEKGNLNRTGEPKHLFLTTGDAKKASMNASALLKKDIIFSPCSL